MNNYKVPLITILLASCFASTAFASNSESQPIENKTKAVKTSNNSNTQIWAIKRGDQDLHSLLNRWCNQMGWQLDWQVNATFPIEFDWTINASFSDAINQILVATQHTEVPLKAIMYSSNRVLKIVKNQ